MGKLDEEVSALCEIYGVKFLQMRAYGPLRVEIDFNLNKEDATQMAVLFSAFNYRYGMRGLSKENGILVQELSVPVDRAVDYMYGKFDESDLYPLRDYQTEHAKMERELGMSSGWDDEWDEFDRWDDPDAW